MISIVHIFMNVNKLCLNQQVCELALKQGFVKEFDAGVKSPFAHKGRLWISYDDDTSLRYKVRAKQTAANNVTSCLVRTQTPSTFYNILPSTTAVFSYAIGSRKLSANKQFFFIVAQTVVSLLQKTQIISDVCFITDHVAYAS